MSSEDIARFQLHNFAQVISDAQYGMAGVSGLSGVLNNLGPLLAAMTPDKAESESDAARMLREKIHQAAVEMDRQQRQSGNP